AAPARRDPASRDSLRAAASDDGAGRGRGLPRSPRPARKDAAPPRREARRARPPAFRAGLAIRARHDGGRHAREHQQASRRVAAQRDRQHERRPRPPARPGLPGRDCRAVKRLTRRRLPLPLEPASLSEWCRDARRRTDTVATGARRAREIGAPVPRGSRARAGANQDADRLSRLAARGDAFRGIAPGRAPQVLRRSFRFRAGGPRLKVRAPMNPVFVALATMDRLRARALAAAVRPHVGGLKLGLDFFCANGPEAVRHVADDAPLFLDLKLHDIPNTVAGAVRAVLPLRPAFLTVHAAGGPAMLRAAVDA